MAAKTLNRIWSNTPFAGIVAAGKIEIAASECNDDMSIIMLDNHAQTITMCSRHFEIYTLESL